MMGCLNMGPSVMAPVHEQPRDQSQLEASTNGSVSSNEPSPAEVYINTICNRSTGYQDPQFLSRYPHSKMVEGGVGTAGRDIYTYCIRGDHVDDIRDYIIQQLAGWNVVKNEEVPQQALSMLNSPNAPFRIYRAVDMAFGRQTSQGQENVTVQITLIGDNNIKATIYMVTYME